MIKQLTFTGDEAVREAGGELNPARNQDFCAQLDRLLQRGVHTDQSVLTAARRIVDTVRADGDAALLAYTREFDQHVVAKARDLEWSSAEACGESIAPELLTALTTAAARIRHFHEQEQAQRAQAAWQYTEADGTIIGQYTKPLARVGIYVPGGKASYPSSVLMTAIPARVAGVGEIIMTVPTPRGELNPAVLAAAKIAGVGRIFTIGGAQAIAALAYGTATIPAVDKIVGPGNAYVAAAKKIVFGDVGIDLVAGPSQVVVIADESADPEWVAMDLFAQAEHDEKAQAILITDSAPFAAAVLVAMQQSLAPMTRRAVIEQSLAAYGAIIQVETLSQAMAIANYIAPEHLELMMVEPHQWLDQVQHAGAIFCGKYSAEVLGDYCAGPNHVLPTAGTARFSSPLGVDDFQKRSTLLQASPAGARRMAKTAACIAASEGLTAHMHAAQLRANTE